jgi:hypothetical protein
MSLAEQGKRSGLKRQATGLVSSFASLAPGTLTIPAPDSTEKTAAKPGATLLNRRKGLRLVDDKRPDTLAQAIKTSLARELDLMRAEIAQQKPRYPAAAATSRPFPAVAATPRPAASAASPVQERERTQALEERAEHLAQENALLSRKLAEIEKAAADMQEASAKAIEEREDRVVRESALLSQKIAEADNALKGANVRIKSLEEKSAAAAEAENELRAGRDLLHQQVESASAENAGLARAATDKERALADARTRVEYLEAALAAAEAECARLQAEAAGRDSDRAETAALKTSFDDMSTRAMTAEKLLAETRERLLAQVAEFHDAERCVVRANALSSDAFDRQRQLEDALSLQQSRFAELERSQATLTEASTHLLQRFRERDRALAAAEETIKALAERNARLETAGRRGAGASVLQADLPRAGETADQDWVELARLLSDFIERKASSRRTLSRPSQA